MQRLISLFREPEELSSRSPRVPERSEQPAGVREPVYFVQLLEYLCQRREAIESAQRASASSQQN
jgi:hypothetical protein